MKKYNKIVLASQMFEKAHDLYDSAQVEMDYVTSILLSGAVVGIIAPLLEEQGGSPMHEILVRVGNAISREGDEKQHQGMYRETYNSLKHAGNNRSKLKPSDDLVFETNIEREAAHMLDVAKSDFSSIDVSTEVRGKLTTAFVTLLESSREYA